MAFYFFSFPFFDSGAVGDYFRGAVDLAIKARKTDLNYPAVGLSDYSGMMPIATSSCQPVVAIACASSQGFALPACSAASEQLLSVAGCTESVSERRTAFSQDNVDNILFLHKIGLIIQIPVNRFYCCSPIAQ